MPIAETLHLEKILEKRVNKETRGKEYFEYLIKWRDHPVEDSIWMTTTILQKSGNTIEILITGVHAKIECWESNVGA